MWGKDAVSRDVMLVCDTIEFLSGEASAGFPKAGIRFIHAFGGIATCS